MLRRLRATGLVIVPQEELYSRSLWPKVESQTVLQIPAPLTTGLWPASPSDLALPLISAMPSLFDCSQSFSHDHVYVPASGPWRDEISSCILELVFA